MRERERREQTQNRINPCQALNAHAAAAAANAVADNVLNEFTTVTASAAVDCLPMHLCRNDDCALNVCVPSVMMQCCADVEKRIIAAQVLMVTVFFQHLLKLVVVLLLPVVVVVAAAAVAVASMALR